MSSISQAHEQVQKVKELKKKKGPKSRRLPADSFYSLKMSSIKHTDSELEKWTDSPVASFVCPANSILRESQRKACIELFSISLSDAFSHSMSLTVFHFPRLHTLTGPSVCKRHSVFKWCLAPQTVSFYKASQVSQWLYQRLPHDINNADLALSVWD